MLDELRIIYRHDGGGITKNSTNYDATVNAIGYEHKHDHGATMKQCL
jgi:regulator of PEP synthase PpsR (kinase-PPPase family)